MIAAGVLPHIKKYAEDTATKLATQHSNTILATAYRNIVPDAMLVRANEAFVLRFSKELDYTMDLATLTASAYQEAIATFLRHDAVQDALQVPLDGQSDIDWNLLRSICVKSLIRMVRN